jgi:hypothetical protein
VTTLETIAAGGEVEAGEVSDEVLGDYAGW